MPSPVPGEVAATLSVTLAVLALFAATLGRRGSLLSPFSLVLLILVSIFGARPLLMADAQNFDFYGISVEAGYDEAAWVGLIAIVSLIVGYGFGALALPKLKMTAPRPVVDFLEAPVFRRGFVLSVITLFGYVLALILFGGGLSLVLQSLGGRSAEVNAGSTNMPVLIPALPVAAAIAVAWVRSEVARSRHLTRREEIYYWASFVLLVLPPAVLGNRRFLIPTVIVFLIGAASSVWRKRLSLRICIVAGVGILALMIFPFVRSAGSRTGSSDLLGAMIDYFGESGLRGTLDGFFLSYDTEMFNYVSYLAPHLGRDLEFGMGRGTIGDALLAPIPSAFAPASSWSNHILTSVFGVTCAQGVCPVPSIVGVLLYDLSYLGVVGGMLAIGFAASRFEPAFHRSSGPKLVVLIAIAGFAPIVARGNSVAIAWIALNSILAALVMCWIIRRKVTQRVVANPARVAPI